MWSGGAVDWDYYPYYGGGAYRRLGGGCEAGRYSEKGSVKRIVIGLVLISVLGSAARAVERPNVLFLAVDDLRDWVGFLDGYGGEVHTPNLDRLGGAGDGVL